MNISICMTLKDRADLLQWGLESISRQDYDHRKVEICILDGGSKDKLFNLIDRYSDQFVFKYALEDRSKAYIPVTSNAPGASLNVMIRYMASANYIIKADPEIIFKDEWIISEIFENLSKDDSKMYNARAHFTADSGWFQTYDDIIRGYEKHYLMAEGGPFSRSKFYFLSGFSKAKFMELGGIEELFGYGIGYEDTCFREMWKNKFGSYEEEITGSAIHLWHGPNKGRPAWEIANRRIFENLKYSETANLLRLDGKGGTFMLKEPQWANPEMLSKIYTIKGGQVTMVDDVNDGKSVEVDLPF